MADAYWRYADARHQAAAQAAAQAAVVVPTPQPALKRPRSDYPGTSHLAALAITSFFRLLLVVFLILCFGFWLFFFFAAC